MFEFFFNPITHSISILLMFGAMVYGLVLTVLGYFKRKKWIKRLVLKNIYEDGAVGIYSFLGILLGLVALMDSYIPYASDHEVFASLLVMYGILLFFVLLFTVVFFVKLHNKIPEE